jgi:hypothetical protein
VQLRVLRSHGQLGRDRGQKSRFALLHPPSPRQIDGEQSHELLTGHQRDGQRRVDLRLCDGVADRRQPQIGLGVRDVEHALSAERPKRELEEALCDGELRIGS